MSNPSFCTQIVFSNRAYNAVVSETSFKISTETGGILLGQCKDGIWYVVEALDPGPNSQFSMTYFEYDTAYVNHLAKRIATQYHNELSLLGLWHRHPGSMDTFSSTDDGTNTLYAKLKAQGSISGLINIDPQLRLTMYHVEYPPLTYRKIPYLIDDNSIPKEYLRPKYSFNSKGNLTPEHLQLGQATLLKVNKVETRTKPKKSGWWTRGAKPALLPLEQQPDEQPIEDKLLDILSKEEVLLMSKFDNYESTIAGVDDHTFSYSLSLSQPQQIAAPPAHFPRRLEMLLKMDTDKAYLVIEHAYFPYKDGIVTRYLESKLEDIIFKG